jgi:NADPH2:quinone reductase
MSNQMRAIVMNRTGGPEVLTMRTVPLPWPPTDSHHVLVSLKAAGLNPADLWFRRSGPYIHGTNPCVLGHEGSGVVEDVGSAEIRFRPGDEVCFCNGGIGGDYGTYAEYAVVHEDQLVRKPSGISFEDAAALPLVFITAWEALVVKSALAPGEYVLVGGGVGGTGHLAIQLATVLGARVASVVRSQAKASIALELGAERAIFYRQDSIVDAALQWSGGHGLDVMFDNLGPDVMKDTVRAMAPYGRIATLLSRWSDDDDATAYNRNVSVHHVMMLAPMLYKLHSRLRDQASYLAEGLKLLEEGRVRVLVEKTFPWQEIAAAHSYMESGGIVGKTVIEITR